MTRPTRKTSRNTATIWHVTGKDAYGKVTYGSPYLIKCTYMSGSSRQFRDGRGNILVPDQIFWYERPEQGLPPLDSVIALGDYLAIANPVSVVGAKFIKMRELQDSAVLNDTPDIMLLT